MPGLPQLALRATVRGLRGPFRPALPALPDAIVGATSFALHPDGRRAAIGSRSKLVLVDLHTGAELASLAFGDSPQSLDFHPDGSHLACASSNGTRFESSLRIWATERPVR